jgi:hypothetical protein
MTSVNAELFHREQDQNDPDREYCKRCHAMEPSECACADYYYDKSKDDQLTEALQWTF